MSSGMFRGKESSNRIELSRLVQVLLNFGVSGFLWLWGWEGGWMGIGVVDGCPNTCTHACACTHAQPCTCMCGKHDNFMQMATPILGIHGNSLWCHMHMCVCVCMHACTCMCTCVGGTPYHPHPIHPSPPPPGEDPRNQSKFNTTWTNQVETPPLKGGCIVW